MATAAPSQDRRLRRPRVTAEFSSLVQPQARPDRPSLDRRLLLVLCLAAAVVLPRSYLVAQAHSESIDDDYHLKRGLLFLTGGLAASELDLNDPPLGEGLIAIPMLVTNLIQGRGLADNQIYDRPGRADTIAVMTALWNALFFLGFLGVVFTWCRRVYGERSAVFAVALFVVEANFAAHVPIPALDVLGVEGIVLATFLAWRYFERPSTARLIAMAIGIAVAMMVKHTAVVLPAVILALAGIHWVLRPWLDRQSWTVWKGAFFGRARALALMAAMVPVAIWALTLFDFSPPLTRAAIARQAIGTNGAAISPGKSLRVRLERALRLDAPWPAGCYLRAFRTGMGHGMAGHQSYLNGVRRDRGSWDYFPVVASYKVPIGIGVVLLLSCLSLGWAPAHWAEWGLFVPMAVWALLMLNSNVNIGFRHFLPSYAFMMMLASRCVVRPARAWAALAWAGVVAAGAHGLTYHPDYLCYLNAPRNKAYLAISDSNVDWGQSLKQVRAWVDANVPAERDVSFRYFGKEAENQRFYLNDRVRMLGEHSPRPTSGLLLISPVRLVGVYEKSDPYAALRPYSADAVIGNSILVFDLDRLRREAQFRWPSRAGSFASPEALSLNSAGPDRDDAPPRSAGVTTE